MAPPLIPFEDRRLVFHEAAHAIVAVALGAVAVHIGLSRDRAGKLVGGGVLDPNGTHPSSVPAPTLAAICYAGAIAELLMRNFAISEDDCFDFVEHSDESGLSDVDRPPTAVLPAAKRRSAFSAAFCALKSNWIAVRGTAWELLHERCDRYLFTGDMLREYAAGQRTPAGF